MSESTTPIATPPAGFTLNERDFELTGTPIYDGPQRGPVSTHWSPDGRPTVLLDGSPGSEYTVSEARRLAADLFEVLADLGKVGLFR